MSIYASWPAFHAVHACSVRPLLRSCALRQRYLVGPPSCSVPWVSRPSAISCPPLPLLCRPLSPYRYPVLLPLLDLPYPVHGPSHASHAVHACAVQALGKAMVVSGCVPQGDKQAPELKGVSTLGAIGPPSLSRLDHLGPTSITTWACS